MPKAKKTQSKTIAKAKNAKVIDIQERLSKYAAPSATAPERPANKVVAPTSALMVPPAQLPEGVLPIAASTPQLAAKIGLLVLTAQTLPEAREMLQILKANKEKLEGARKFLTGPLKAHIKTIEEVFRSPINAIEAADAMLRRKVLVFQNEAAAAVEKAKVELAAEAQAAFEQGDDAVALALSQQAVSIQAATVKGKVSTGGGVGVASRTRFRIVDYALVPDHYWKIDETRIAADVRAGNHTIPGVEVYEEAELRVSTKDRVGGGGDNLS